MHAIIFKSVESVRCFLSSKPAYLTLDHETSHKGTFFEIEIYTRDSENISEIWINKLSSDVWFVMIRQYLAEIQLFENLESEVAKKSCNL